MSLAQRLQRLEALEGEQRLREVAERLATEFGVAPDDALRQLREVAARIERWGIDAELHRLAGDFGVSEVEVRARYQTEVARLEQAAPEAAGP